MSIGNAIGAIIATKGDLSKVTWKDILHWVILAFLAYQNAAKAPTPAPLPPLDAPAHQVANAPAASAQTPDKIVQATSSETALLDDVIEEIRTARDAIQRFHALHPTAMRDSPPAPDPEPYIPPLPTGPDGPGKRVK